jgi:hypothetical protein
MSDWWGLSGVKLDDQFDAGSVRTVSHHAWRLALMNSRWYAMRHRRTHQRGGQPGRALLACDTRLTRCMSGPVFKDLGGDLVRRKEALDAQLLHGHILWRAERGDRGE